MNELPSTWPLTADLAPLVFEVDGRLKPAELRDRLCQLTARHESLRLRHDRADVRLDPEQAVDAAFSVATTLSGDIVDVATAMAMAGYRRPGAPLWSVRHVRRTDGTEHLLVGLDRGVADSWSLHIVAEELIDLYGCGGDGTPPGRGMSAASASEMAAHRASVADGDLAAEHDYWSVVLSDLDFGTDPRVGRSLSLPAVTNAVMLGDDEAVRVADLAAARRTTVFAVLVAAVHRVWGRWIGTDDTLLLTEVGHRDDPRFDRTVASVAEPRPVRVRSARSMEFTDIVDSVRGVTLDVLDHCSVPLAVDDRPVRPFIRAVDRMTVLVEFDTPNAPSAVRADPTLRLRDDIAVRCARASRADLHIMLRLGERGPELYVAHNPLAMSAAGAANFRAELADVLRSAVGTSSVM